MKHKKCEFSYLFAVTILSIFISFIISGQALSLGLYNWNAGATGYELAFEEAQEKESPMILFFFIDSDEK